MRQGKLLGIYIEICSMCNQNCIYCYNEKVIREKVYLSCEEVNKIIDEANDLGIKTVTLSGGEPLCHPDFQKIVKHIYDKNCKAFIITNATLIDKNMAEFLAVMEPDLQLTLDGGNSQIHDQSRGIGTFDKQKLALDLLRKSDFKGTINIRVNLWKGNLLYNNLESIIEFCQQYGITMVNFSLAHETEKFSGEIDDYKNCKQISEWVNILKDKYPTMNLSFKEGELDFGCPFVTEEATVNCGLRVTPYGDVFPCQLFDDPLFKIGNIKVQSIEEVLNGRLLSNFLDMMRIRTVFIKECAECVYQGTCHGGCPAITYLQSSNILSVDKKCGERKMVLQAGVLNAIKVKT